MKIISSEDALLIFSKWKSEESPLRLFAGGLEEIPSGTSGPILRITEISGIPLNVVLSSPTEGSRVEVDLEGASDFKYADLRESPWKNSPFGTWLCFVEFKLFSGARIVLAEIRTETD